MSRQNSSRYFTLLGVALAAGATLLVVRELARSANRDGAVRSSAVPRAHGGSYAQRSRGAGEVDQGYPYRGLAGGEGKSARRVSAARVEERAKRLTAPSSPSSPSRSGARSTR